MAIWLGAVLAALITVAWLEWRQFGVTAVFVVVSVAGAFACGALAAVVVSREARAKKRGYGRRHVAVGERPVRAVTPKVPDADEVRAAVEHLVSQGQRTVDRLTNESPVAPSAGATSSTASVTAGRTCGLDLAALEDQRARYRAGSGEIRAVVEALLTDARQAVERPSRTVMDKSTLAPSGDPHDYWNPAPYWWPNPATADGSPYVLRDGVRVPGTVVGSDGSEQFDRTALQGIFTDTYLCALAGYFTGDRAFSSKAAGLVQAWFVDPHSRMNPHLTYAQVRRGHDDDQGSASGIIDFNGVYFLLDALTLLEIEGGLNPDAQRALHEWFAQYSAWLDASPQGQKAAKSHNNRGTWWAVQQLAITGYLGRPRAARQQFAATQSRLIDQFASDGAQPYELTRTLSQHYVAYNLQAWLCLLQLGSGLGPSVEPARHTIAQTIGLALSWLADNSQAWPHAQIGPFDQSRVTVGVQIAHGVGVSTGTHGTTVDETHPEPPLVFPGSDGIRPYWMLGLPHA